MKATLRILRTFASAAVVLWAVLSITFLLLRLAPGDPFSSERGLPPEVKAQLAQHYGLNEPLWVQYLQFFKGAAVGNFGPSFAHPGWSVADLMAARIPVSLELGLWGLAVAILLGVGAGLIAAAKHGTWADASVRTAALLGIALPSFVLGPLLLWVFAVQLQWLPVSGWFLPEDRILPAITLGLLYAAVLMRLTRKSLLENNAALYLRTARAKGLSPLKCWLVHALRPALSPMLATLGPAVAGLVSGSFVVETVFNIPGLGTLFVQSAFNRDMPLVLGLTAFYATLIIAMNTLTDMLQLWANPKLRG